MTARRKPRLTMPPPAHITGDARLIWRQVVEHLRGTGVLQRVDAGMIETYATSLVRLRRLNAALESAPLLDESGKPHALLRTVEATTASVKNAAHVLGLSPGARRSGSAGIAPPARGGKWEAARREDTRSPRPCSRSKGRSPGRST